MDIQPPAHHCTTRCSELPLWVEAAKNNPTITLQSIGSAYNVSRERIRQLLRDHNLRLQRARDHYCRTCQRIIKTAPIKAHYQSPEHAALRQKNWQKSRSPHFWHRVALHAALYLAYYPQREIATITGYSPPVVYKDLRHAGLEPNHGGFNRYERGKYEHFKAIYNRNAELLALFDSGSSGPEVARLMNLPLRTIHTISHQHRSRKNP